MRTLQLLLILLLLAARPNPFAGDGAGDVVLANQTSNAFVYVAFDLAEGVMVDPAPEIDPATVPEQLIAAGESRSIDVHDYSGQGVLLFLYEIPASDRAGPVPLTRTVRVTEGELRRMNNRIVIDGR